MFTQITGTQLTDDGGDLPEAPLALMNAASEIMNPDGTVNRDSEVWQSTPSALFDPKANYREVVGISRVVPSVGKNY